MTHAFFPAVGDLEELPIARRQTLAEAFLVLLDLGFAEAGSAEPARGRLIRGGLMRWETGLETRKVVLSSTIYGLEKVEPGILRDARGTHVRDLNDLI
jgi:hypothetical protein